ncbi:MAG: preprotein translocase subunit SecG [Oscillospiraceae bacterium]|nr:preprotein translocase subunit SecG [Oscillospiraceae bacterium]
MDILKYILMGMQVLSAVALIVIVTLQSGKENGLGALAGNSESYMGKNKGNTMDAKLARITKWIGAAFVLLTLFVSLLYTAA